MDDPAIIKLSRVLGGTLSGGLTTPAVGYNGPGDLVSGAVGAWALRAWSRSAIGSRAIRLIASADAGVTGNTSDFVTLSDGSLDVASIATFQAANPGTTLFVNILYDQTRSGQDLTCFAQVSNYVPKFQLAGFGTRPVIFQDNLNMNLTSGGPSYSTPTITFGSPFTMMSVFNYNEAWGGVMPIQLEATGPNFSQMGLFLNSGGTNPNKIDIRTSVGAAFDISGEMPCSDFNWHSAIGIFNAAGSICYIDGGGIAQPAMIALAPDPNGFVGLFGSPFGAGNTVPGSSVEGALWNRVLSPAEVANVTSNQRSYWVF